MNHIKNFAFLVFFFMLSGCIPQEPECREQKTVTNNISPFERARIHYKGNETLIFVRNGTDTHTFVGTGIINDYGSNSAYFDHECPPDLAKIEFAAVTFQSSTFSSPIFYRVAIEKYEESPRILINFNSQNFYNVFISVITGTPKYDSLIIAGNTHHSLYFLSEITYPPTENYYLLMNNTTGILKFKFTNGETWELIKRVD